MRIGLTLVFALLAGMAFGQKLQKDSPKVESELFMNKPNAIVEKKMTAVGTVQVKYGMVKEDMEVSALTLKDMDSGELRQCMVFDVLDKNKYTLIESDEIEGFEKMLNQILDKYIKTTPNNYTELVYNTRSGTEAGCFFDEDKWVIFMRLHKEDSSSVIEITQANLEQLKIFVGRVKEVIARTNKPEGKN